MTIVPTKKMSIVTGTLILQLFDITCSLFTHLIVVVVVVLVMVVIVIVVIVTCTSSY